MHDVPDDTDVLACVGLIMVAAVLAAVAAGGLLAWILAT